MGGGFRVCLESARTVWLVSSALGAKIPIARSAGGRKSSINLFAAIPAVSDFPFAAARGTGHCVPKQSFAPKGSLAA